MSTKLTAAARQRLLRWFDLHQRDLPWRADRDPYKIWVSEVMLQQTLVATVIGYFDRFLNTFPTVRELAKADEQTVLRLWEGLGYYRRARDLHKAAKQLVQEQDGLLPDDPNIWKDLPGVGRYILGAVLSQAFDRRLPIVEANTKRVLCRLFGQFGDLNSKEVQKWLWETAEAILPHKRVGDFNQALMELGALICTANDPDCSSCPLQQHCYACQNNKQAELPAKTLRPETVPVREVALVIQKKKTWLLCQRPRTGRWANMWEFPHLEYPPQEEPDTAAKRLLEELGIQAQIGAELITIKHGVTRFEITMLCLEANWLAGTVLPGRYVQAKWVSCEELISYPVSSPQRKLAQLISQPSRQLRLF